MSVHPTGAPRNYAVRSFTTEPRKCLICGHKNYCHTLLKVGVRHYVHTRCAVDNDPGICFRMPRWVLQQMPISSFDGQPRPFFEKVLRHAKASS